jgi:hypothetical protein
MCSGLRDPEGRRPRPAARSSRLVEGEDGGSRLLGSRHGKVPLYGGLDVKNKNLPQLPLSFFILLILGPPAEPILSSQPAGPLMAVARSRSRVAVEACVSRAQSPRVAASALLPQPHWQRLGPQIECIFERTVKTICPEMRSRSGIDELP